jgi:leucyl-tRNA synthetase
MTQGMLLNHSYFRRGESGGVDYFAPEDVDTTHDAEGHISGGKLRSDGGYVAYGGVSKMSKSEKNGIDPQELIGKYGADTARMFIMFAGPPDESALWSNSGVEGAQRFLKRLWAHGQQLAELPAPSVAIDWAGAPQELRALRRELHVHLKQADDDYQRIKYNTVVSAAMKMLNTLERVPSTAMPAANALAREGMSLLLRVLNPVVPHITHALWEQLGYAALHGDIVDAPWPQVDQAALAQEEIELVLQVNGKLRGKLTVAAGADATTIEAAAIASTHVQRAMAEGQRGGPAKVLRVIVVPKRLVNVVLAAPA